MSVVLPLPLGPSRPVTVPRATSRSSPGSTSLPAAHDAQARGSRSAALTIRRVKQSGTLAPMVPVFSAADVERAVSPHEAYDAVRDAFVAYARGEWTMPPKVYVTNYPAGDFRAMPAIGGGHALLKWVTSFPGNPARGLPTVTGLVLLSDAETGGLLAVLDAAAVTALRTAAAAVLAADTLCRAGSRRRTRSSACGVNGAETVRMLVAHGAAPARVGRRRGASRAVAERARRARRRRAPRRRSPCEVVVTVTPGSRCSTPGLARAGPARLAHGRGRPGQGGGRGRGARRARTSSATTGSRRATAAS